MIGFRDFIPFNRLYAGVIGRELLQQALRSDNEVTPRLLSETYEALGDVVAQHDFSLSQDRGEVTIAHSLSGWDMTIGEQDFFS